MQRESAASTRDAEQLRAMVPLAVVLLLAYLIADALLRSIAVRGLGVIPWYAGAGIALALLTVTGPVGAIPLFFARLLLYWWPTRNPSTPLAAIVESMLHVSAYLMASTLIRRRVLDGVASWRTVHAAWLIAAVTLAASATAAISAVRGILLGMPPRMILRGTVIFAAGDAAGALVLLPLLLVLLHQWVRHLRPGLDSAPHASVASPDALDPLGVSARGATALSHWGEVPAFLLSVLVCWLLRVQGTLGIGYSLLICLAPLAWISVREGLRGAALVIAGYGVAWALIASTLGTPEQVGAYQAMLLSLGVMGLLLGTARTVGGEGAARYWQLVDSAHEGVWRLDAEGRTLYLNRRMIEILGRSAQEAMGHEVRDYIAPEDRAKWDRERALREQGNDTTYEVRLLRPDGTRVEVMVTGSVVRSSTTGEPIGAVAIVNDVSAMRRTEAESRRAQVLLQGAFRSSRDAMVLFRATDELIVDVNDEWCRVTGYRRDQVLGRSQRDLQLWGDPADSVRLGEAIALHGEVHDFEVAFNRHVSEDVTERGYALLSAQPVVVDEVTYFLVIGRDITIEKRRADAERQIQRLEELGRMAGNVAHDFNNLLTVVLGYTQLIRSSLADGKPVPRADVDEIERAGRRGQELTRRLLAFSRNQPTEPRVVDAREVVQRAKGMLSSIVGSQVRFDVTTGGTPLPILVDPGQMDQLLLNLAVNARDAMPDGGELAISTLEVDLQAADVDQIGFNVLPGRYVQLRVRDTGVGMDEATRIRAFEPFFTTKPAGKGTGLGLAAVYGIVRQARGAVHVESAPGEGTTFDIYWPSASLAPVPIDLSVAEAEPLGDMHGARVLLVEDDATVRRITRRVLENAGYEVFTASDGVRALACLTEMEEDGTPPDMVLSDVMMPNMGGRELAESLAARVPDLPVVLMTGNTAMSEVREGLQNVPLPVLDKPFEVPRLLRLVEQAVELRRQRHR